MRTIVIRAYFLVYEPQWSRGQAQRSLDHMRAHPQNPDPPDPVLTWMEPARPGAAVNPRDGQPGMYASVECHTI